MVTNMKEGKGRKPHSKRSQEAQFLFDIELNSDTAEFLLRAMGYLICAYFQRFQ